MRIHLTLDDDLVAELDRRRGTRQRSTYVAELIHRALEDERWNDIEAALGSIPDRGHLWDESPADWVRSQRSADTCRAD